MNNIMNNKTATLGNFDDDSIFFCKPSKDSSYVFFMKLVFMLEIEFIYSSILLVDFILKEFC